MLNKNNGIIMKKNIYGMLCVVLATHNVAGADKNIYMRADIGLS
ncbi:MAG: hypothetical protein ACI8ZF_001053 [Candidatus Midichloriaceae bacterium]|jgi:hypothetical protein